MSGTMRHLTPFQRAAIRDVNRAMKVTGKLVNISRKEAPGAAYVKWYVKELYQSEAADTVFESACAKLKQTPEQDEHGYTIRHLPESVDLFAPIAPGFPGACVEVTEYGHNMRGRWSRVVPTTVKDLLAVVAIDARGDWNVGLTLPHTNQLIADALEESGYGDQSLLDGLRAGGSVAMEFVLRYK
jgi:hypothetical protein